jgi:hypothetical protein
MKNPHKDQGAPARGTGRRGVDAGSAQGNHLIVGPSKNSLIAISIAILY